MSQPTPLAVLLATASSCLLLVSGQTGWVSSDASTPEMGYRQVVTDFALANNEALTLLDSMNYLDGVGDYLHSKYGIQNRGQLTEMLQIVKRQHTMGKFLLDTHQRLPDELAQAKMDWQRAELIRAAQTLMGAQRRLENKIAQLEQELGPKEVSGGRDGRASRVSAKHRRVTHHANQVMSDDEMQRALAKYSDDYAKLANAQPDSGDRVHSHPHHPIDVII